MSLYFLLFLILFSGELHAQKCQPTTSVKAIIWPYQRNNTSADKGVIYCGGSGVMTSDTAYSVTGFKFTLYTTDGSLPVTKEVEVQGRLFQGVVKRLISEAKAGDTIFITCVKAEHISGRAFILQPIMFEVK